MPIKNGYIPFSAIPIWEWLFILLLVAWSIKTIRRVLSTLHHKNKGTPKQEVRSFSDLSATLPSTATIPVTMTQIDQMDGVTFERFLKTFFEKQGYYTTLTPHYDWGGDLVMHKDGVRTLVQAKRWKQQVTMSAVQEVVAAKAKYRADRVMVVTNSTFTHKAKELARVNEVVLWNRDTLAAQLRRFPVAFIQGAAQELTDSSCVEAQSANHSVEPASGKEAQKTVSLCCTLCGKTVTDSVANYCRANAPRFSNQIYCFAHQKAFPHQKTVGSALAETPREEPQPIAASEA